MGTISWTNEAQRWLEDIFEYIAIDDINAAGAAERVDWHRALIQRWINENPPGVGNGWEPYTLSLRTGTGVVIPPEQPEVLAETVLRLFENRDELAGLARGDGG